MARSISRTEKRRRGRPRTNPTSVHLSLAPDLLARIDQFLAAQKDTPSRPETIRRLIELALGDLEPAKQLNPRAKSKAVELAANQIDKLIDPSATDEERQRRKRRLLKGPGEFRDLRGDLPKPKP
jgi:metal-responsive CopG/Arc/MetJ family transcriptional regulator